MKLLQLNVTANWGSTGKIAEGIGQMAIANGWESYIAYGRDCNPSQTKLIKVGSKKDVYRHYAFHRILDGEGFGSKNATKKLVKEIDNLNPDIIHLHNIHDHWLNYPILFEYLASINTPIVWTFHDCWAFTGGCMYFEMPYCGKWQSLCGSCSQKKGRIDLSGRHLNSRKRLFKAIVDRLTIVPVSGWLETYVKNSFLKDAAIEMIHNGIDVSSFTISGTKSEKPMILGVANLWDYRKGLSDIINLRNSIPKEVADIVIVGLSKKQINSLPPDIIGITRTQNVYELVELYNRAWVLVNPTYADNFPTVNLEALACGTPVVTYRTGGSPEAVDPTTGVVIEQGDVSTLLKCIREIVYRKRIFRSEDCRKRAECLFNKEIQFARYIDLYDKLLK